MSSTYSICSFNILFHDYARLVMDFLENALDTAGDNDKSENHENLILGEYYEIKPGMQVSSEEEAYNLYNEYALNKGFSIQKWVTRKIDGVLRQ